MKLKMGVTALATMISALALNAAELKSFVGVNFGEKPTGDKFEGPNEDGDYTFKPTFELGAYQYASVSLDDDAKVIDTIGLTQVFKDLNDAVKFFEYVNQRIKRLYSKVGIVEQCQGTALWDEVVKSFAAAGLQHKKLRIWAVLNETGDVNQFVTVSLQKTESGSPMVLVSASDNTVVKKNSGAESETTCLPTEAVKKSKEKPRYASDTLEGKLETFMGYRFGEKYGFSARQNGEVDKSDRTLCNVKLPKFRYMDNGWLKLSKDGRLVEVVLEGDIDDVMSDKIAREEFDAVVAIFQKKYGINFGIKESKYGGWLKAEYENEKKTIKISIKLSDRTMYISAVNRTFLEDEGMPKRRTVDEGIDVL